VFARSAGTYARILSFDWSSHTAALGLPSGQIRRVSLHLCVAVGAVAFADAKRLSNTKAGFA